MLKPKPFTIKADDSFAEEALKFIIDKLSIEYSIHDTVVTDVVKKLNDIKEWRKTKE